MTKLTWAIVAVASIVAVPTLVAKFNYVKEYSSSVIDVPVITATNVIDKPILVNRAESKKSVLSITPPAARTVTIFGEIGSDAAEVAAKISEMSVKSDKPIYLLINSPGGSVLDGAQIVSAIQGSRAPVYTICTMLCASMAAIIHQYGTERYATDRSILMFHEAAGGMQGYVNHMLSRLTMLTNYVNKMDDYIAQRSGMPLADFRKGTANELWLDAEDALAKKFVDKLVTVNLANSEQLMPSLGSKWVTDKLKFKVQN